MPGCATKQGIHCWALCIRSRQPCLQTGEALVSTSYNGAAAAVGTCGFFPFNN